MSRHISYQWTGIQKISTARMWPGTKCFVTAPDCEEEMRLVRLHSRKALLYVSPAYSTKIPGRETRPVCQNLDCLLLQKKQRQVSGPFSEQSFKPQVCSSFTSTSCHIPAPNKSCILDTSSMQLLPPINTTLLPPLPDVPDAF